MKVYKALFTLILLLAVAAPAFGGGVADTWAKRFEKAPKGTTEPVGVVLFFHGCSGYASRPEITTDTDAWAEAITRAGYRFVAPDSWARGRSRPDGCAARDVETAKQIRLLRIEEIAYAVAQLLADPTVDQSRIVLFGHSEGGIAVASAEPPSGTRAIIVSGWTCHASIPLGMGIAAAPAVAVLAMEFEHDPTLRVQGRCSEFFPGRTMTKELILPGSGHNLGGSVEARRAVADFLAGLGGKP